MKEHKIYTMSFARVYPLYVAKAEKKGRTKIEVNKIIYWLTGYTKKGLEVVLEKKIDFKTFFSQAPKLNPLRNHLMDKQSAIQESKPIHLPD